MNDYDDIADLDPAADQAGAYPADHADAGLGDPGPFAPHVDPGSYGLLAVPADLSDGSAPGPDGGFGGLFTPSLSSAASSSDGPGPLLSSPLDPGPPISPFPTSPFATDDDDAGVGLLQAPPSAAQPSPLDENDGDDLPAAIPDYPASGRRDQPIAEASLPPVAGGPQTAAAPAGAPRRASRSTLSPAGAAFIKSWEQGPHGGVAKQQYPSPEGGSDTIGWGHKIQPGENFTGGLSPAAADRLFDADSLKHQRLVQSNVKVPLTPNQYDALVSLAYNAPAALKNEDHSTLLRLLNKGDYAGAAAQFSRWNHVGKKVSPGLTARRAGETNIFLNGAYSNHR